MNSAMPSGLLARSNEWLAHSAEARAAILVAAVVSSRNPDLATLGGSR